MDQSKCNLIFSQVAKRSLEFFNSYFGKRYPLPKMDLVALSRLSVGAMENWFVFIFFYNTELLVT